MTAEHLSVIVEGAVAKATTMFKDDLTKNYDRIDNDFWITRRFEALEMTIPSLVKNSIEIALTHILLENQKDD